LSFGSLHFLPENVSCFVQWDVYWAGRAAAALPESDIRSEEGQVTAQGREDSFIDSEKCHSPTPVFEWQQSNLRTVKGRHPTNLNSSRRTPPIAECRHWPMKDNSPLTLGWPVTDADPTPESPTGDACERPAQSIARRHDFLPYYVDIPGGSGSVCRAGRSPGSGSREHIGVGRLTVTEPIKTLINFSVGHFITQIRLVAPVLNDRLPSDNTSCTFCRFRKDRDRSGQSSRFSGSAARHYASRETPYHANARTQDPVWAV